MYLFKFNFFFWKSAFLILDTSDKEEEKGKIKAKK